MALFSMVFKKILKNKWLMASLLIGMIISVALISSIPIYTSSVLQRVLIEELESYQTKEEKFPGGYLVSVHLDDQPIYDAIEDARERDEMPLESSEVKKLYEEWLDIFTNIDNYSKDDLADNIGMPVLARAFNYSTDVLNMTWQMADGFSDPDGRRYIRIQSLSNIEEHIRLIDGRLPTEERIDDVYEVLISESALVKQKMVLDKVFIVSDLNMKGMEPIKIRPVGVFTVGDESDPYWGHFTPQGLSESLILPEAIMQEDFINRDSITLLTSARWYFAFDYHSLKLDSLQKVVRGHKENRKTIRAVYEEAFIDAPALKIIGEYFGRERQLRIMMWTLNVPLIIMLFLYLFMICKFIMSREKNEIAMLASRGATRWQIVLSYLIQGMILGTIALILGPKIGLFLCRVLGASSGFLEFVKRKALPVSLSGEVYRYAIITVGVSLLVIGIPAYLASNTSIVSHKRDISRQNKKAIWEKMGFDFIFLGISA